MPSLVAFIRRLPVRGRHDAPDARFTECYEAEYAALRRHVRRLAGRRLDPDEIVQEAFARLWRELDRGAAIANLRAWLYRVVTNVAIDTARGRARESHPEAAPEPAFPADLERDAIRRQLVRRALGCLPEPMRQALLLSQAGLTGAEIAEVLGVKPSYVGTLVLRAHERFRKEFEAVERR